MSTYESKSLAVMRRQAKALERIADALERVVGQQPIEGVELEGVVTWQDAVNVMKATCRGADECGPGCPANEWCRTYNKGGSVPAKWEPIEKEAGE